MDLNEIPFELRVILGHATLEAGHYQTLHLGDIIVLDQLISKGLTTFAGTNETFRATIGLMDNHKAIVIDELIYP